MAAGDLDAPLALTRAEMIALDAREATVRVEGTTAPGRRLPGKAMLVIELDGRRHRFPQGPTAGRAREEAVDAWTGIFTIPAWLEPHLTEQSFLIVEDVTIPLPGSGSAGTSGIPGSPGPEGSLPWASESVGSAEPGDARESGAARVQARRPAEPGSRKGRESREVRRREREPAAGAVASEGASEESPANTGPTLKAVRELLEELRGLDAELESWQEEPGR